MTTLARLRNDPEYQATWRKLLKAETKHKAKKVRKHSRRLMEMTLEANRSGG